MPKGIKGFVKNHKINQGRIWTKELREKAKNSHMGKKQSEETKRKRSKSLEKAHKEGKFDYSKNYNPNKGKGKGSIDLHGYKIISKYPKTIKNSHFVWCNQPENLSYVPKGFCIHHLDFNKLNDSPDNLMLMPHGLHTKWHWEIRTC